MDRHEALKKICTLDTEMRQAIAVVIVTAEAQGGWLVPEGETGSIWTSDTQDTLAHLADEILNGEEIKSGFPLQSLH